MSSVTSHTSHTALSERPERSRNAKAQARHRAKRKAYIDQLEQTVTKLQVAVGYTTEQVSALPPPLLKIRELEQDNARLQKENDDLRRLLDPNSRSLSSDSNRRPSMGGYQDSRLCDRDYSLKRRKPHQEGVYISPSDTPPHGPETNTRPPPPLTIPQPLSHHYGNGMGSTSNHNSTQSGPLFNLHGGPAFQMPNTPSGSSATSSPPFSPIQIQGSSHLPMDHRQQHISDHHAMSSYAQPAGHYSSVKVEDDHYHSTTNHANQHSASMYPSYSNTGPSQNHGSMDWHPTYSERTHLHRS